MPRRTSPSASASAIRARPAGPAVNKSVIHVDVMIGSPEMDVEAVDGKGRTLPMIADGSFASGL